MIKFNNLLPYIDGLIFQITKNITQIKIEHHKRNFGKSNYNFFRSIKVFLRMLFGFSIAPLFLASFIGFLCAFFGFGLAIFYTINYLQGKADVAGWTTIVILILLIGGVILLSLGIIGEYIGRMYLTMNNCPKFIVSEITNKNDKKIMFAT